jgi:hypothetical protein
MYRRKPYYKPYGSKRATGRRRLSTLRGRGLYVGGRGGYMSDFGNAIIGGVKRFASSSTGKQAAKIARRMAGMAARDAITAIGRGNPLATAAGAAVGNAISGRGAYFGPGSDKHLPSAAKTMANALLMGKGIDNVPHFSRGNDDLGSLQVTHLEYLGDVFGGSSTGQFAVQAYAINPGLERTFRWLSQTAVNFDEYELKQLCFRYRATVSDLTGTNGQVGTVIIATNYNADEPPFVSKGQMMQYTGAVSGKCSQDVEHYVECQPSKNSGSKGKWIRQSPVLEGQDIKTYDLGTLNIAVTGIPEGFVNQPLGELWMSYTVELRKPKLFSGAGQAISTDWFTQQSAFVTKQNSTAPNNPGLCDVFGNLPFKDISTQGSLNMATWTAESFVPLTGYNLGQQNTIGCQIVTLPSDGAAGHTAVGSLGILFPAAFEGIVEISLWIQIQADASFGSMTQNWVTQMGLPNDWADFAASNPTILGPIFAAIPANKPYPQIGNWTPLNDFPFYTGSLLQGDQPRAEIQASSLPTAYAPLDTSPGLTSSGQVTCSWTGHFAVTQSTNGIPNIIPLTLISETFAPPPPAGGPYDEALIAQSILRVVEYNVMSARNQPPALVNALGQPMTYSQP